MSPLVELPSVIRAANASVDDVTECKVSSSVDAGSVEYRWTVGPGEHYEGTPE